MSYFGFRFTISVLRGYCMGTGHRFQARGRQNRRKCDKRNGQSIGFRCSARLFAESFRPNAPADGTQPH